MTAEKERRDEETIKRLDAALAEAHEEILQRDKEESHRIMVLKAEIRARSAAAEVAERELAEAHAEIDRLKYLLAGPHIEAHVAMFPND